MRTKYSAATYKPATSDFSHDVLKYSIKTLKNIYNETKSWTEIFEDEDTHEIIPIDREATTYGRTPSEEELQLARSIVTFLLHHIDDMTQDELFDAKVYSNNLDKGTFQEMYEQKYQEERMTIEEIEDLDGEEVSEDNVEYDEDVIEGSIIVKAEKDVIDYLCTTIDELTGKYGTLGNECGLFLPVNAMIETLHKGIPDFFEGNIMSYEREVDCVTIFAEGAPGVLADLIERKFPEAKVDCEIYD